MRESEFIQTYLVVDEDGDFVVNTKPCPFLGDDNFCSIYEQRPSDCQRFPYTDEDVFIKRQGDHFKKFHVLPDHLFRSGKIDGELSFLIFFIFIIA